MVHHHFRWPHGALRHHHCPSHLASGVAVIHPHLWNLMPQTDEENDKDPDEEQELQDPDYFPYFYDSFLG